MKRTMSKSLFLLFCVFCVQRAQAAVQSVAVMPFENTAKDTSLDWLSIGIPETITNDLLTLKGIVLVERIQLRRVLNEQKLQLTGAIDDKTAVKIGKLIGASILVVGTFQKQQEAIELSARFVDVQTGNLLQTAKAAGQIKDIFGLQDQIVKELAKNLNLELKQEDLAKLSIKPTESLESYQHFGLGALLQAKKDYQGALKELQMATELDPKFAAAKEKFKEVFWSLNKGNYWTYKQITKLKSPKVGNVELPSEQTRRAGGLEDFNGTPAFSYIEETDFGAKYAGSKTIQYYTKAEKGILWIGGKTGSSDDKTDMMTVYTMYEPPSFVFPYEMSVGMRWIDKSTGKMMKRSDITSGELTTFSSVGGEGKMEILRKETIKVPAGTFDCYVIENKGTGEREMTIEGMPPKTIYEAIITQWFAPGIGIVKDIYVDKMPQIDQEMIMEKSLAKYYIE